MAQRIAIIGGGPVGIEAALQARRSGFDVVVFESGRVGAHLRAFGHVTLFTPWHMNTSPEGRELLRVPLAGAIRPRYADDALVTASEFVHGYLQPLAAHPQLRDSIREYSRVTHVGREGSTKRSGPQDSGRSSRRFLLRVKSAGGSAQFETADVVIDASGVYGTPNATGPAGLPAGAEETLGEVVERHLPDVRGASRAQYDGKRVLLVGDGHSAATVLGEIASIGTCDVHWVHRDRGANGVFREIADDALPARRALAAAGNELARSAAWLTRHPGAEIDSYERMPDSWIRVTLRMPNGTRRSLVVDRVIALVGYRPDLEIFRELQVHLCYASEGPMRLAAAMQAGAQSEPAAAEDCLAQVAHGPESLLNPEPGFFILGAKSYGRNTNFLLTIGYQQVRDALGLVSTEPKAGPCFPVARP